MSGLILAIDQGTTSTRAVLFEGANPIKSAQKPHKQIFPQSGWVSHNAEEIYANTLEVVREAVGGESKLAAIGITNQRETLVLWDVRTGEPVCDAIVWQCRRTSEICAKMESDGMSDLIRERTGLLIDPYFTATKIKWALDNVPAVKNLAKQGYLRAGTIDSYLIFRLSKGENHVTDYTNASRTMLFDIKRGCWDEDILDYFGIGSAILPTIVPSSGVVASAVEFDAPIAGIAGDQHAALFGQDCINTGSAKNTYGTGCFLLKNIGSQISTIENLKPNKLLTTIAWHINGKTTYALEGGVFNAGSAVEWLMRELKLVSDVSEINEICARTADTNGAYFVPAFSGLGAPNWDMYARGTICGLSLSTGREHIVRAVMESVAFQSMDLIEHMNEVTGLPLSALKVDGGVSRSDFTMQFQADLLGIPVVRPKYTETTVLGACKLAALGVGMDLGRSGEVERIFEPQKDRYNEMAERYAFWKKAVERAKDWEEQ